MTETARKDRVMPERPVRTTSERRGTEEIVLDPKDGQHRKHHDWYRGEHTNRAPNRLKMVPASAVSDHVLQGWMPPEPLIDHQTRITAFGSCFAANISAWLGKRNYRVSAQDAAAQKAYVVRIGEGMVNSFVIRQQFEWAWEGRSFEQALWHGYDAEEFGYDEEVRAETRALFDRTDVFILTFGLSEVWYDEPTGNVFWRTIPKAAYDPARHKFRVSTIEENRANIAAIHDLIARHRPEAKIIMTLSPIPLVATFRDTSCITANAVSKAILRVALDEVVRAHRAEGRLYYWPSYEIVMDVFGAPFIEDRRHLPHPVLDYIMLQFERNWCRADLSGLPSLTEAWVKALAASNLLPPRLVTVVQKRLTDKLREFAAREHIHPDPEIGAAQRALLVELAAEWEATGRSRG
jgi:hypothetical protein